MDNVGYGLLFAHSTQDREAIFDAGASAIILEEHAQDYLIDAVEAGDYPAVRLFFEDGGWGPESNPLNWFDYARPIITDATIRATQLGKRLWVIGPNEVGISHTYGMFEAYRAIKLWEVGARAIILNAAVGTPTPENLSDFFRGFLLVLIEQDALHIEYAIGLHEYGHIFPWTWLGDFQGEGIFPEVGQWPAIPEPGELGWLVGRFQMLYQIADEFPELDLENATIMMTETGLDVVKSDRWNLPKQADGSPYGGWKTCIGVWFRYWQSMASDEVYAKMLQWLAAYYAQFKKVKKVYPFCVGVHHDTMEPGAGGDYRTFDIGATKALTITLEDAPEPPKPPQTWFARLAQRMVDYHYEQVEYWKRFV